MVSRLVLSNKTVTTTRGRRKSDITTSEDQPQLRTRYEGMGKLLTEIKTLGGKLLALIYDSDNSARPYAVNFVRSAMKN